MMQEHVPHLSLTLGHLYPDQLNLYGDRGNILVLRQRCRKRGIQLRVVELGIGDALAPDEYDLLFIGGGQDKEQAPVSQDLLETKGIGMWAAIRDDMPVLAVCGGYQLLAQYYRPASGPDMKGLGVFDAWTIHTGPRTPRCTGNIAISWNGSTLVGFENHGGRTYLGSAQPLGIVLKGYGNNAQDGTEGAVYRNAFGTYMHGSLLPKNPHFADFLISLALQRSYGASRWTDADADADTDTDTDALSVLLTGKNGNSSVLPGALGVVDVEKEAAPALTALDDELEWEAHATQLERMRLHVEAASALDRSKHKDSGFTTHM